MTDTFEFTLNNPLTEEQWDMITDVDMERTDRVTFYTKHGKQAEFAKVRRAMWITGKSDGHVLCSFCGKDYDWTMEAQYYNYCPNCGAKMAIYSKMIQMTKLNMVDD